LEGIPIEHGKNAFICGGAAEFAAVIREIYLAADEDIARLGRSAVSFIEERYTDSSISDKWEVLFCNAVANSAQLSTGIS
jgi:hypothetical protein